MAFHILLKSKNGFWSGGTGSSSSLPFFPFIEAQDKWQANFFFFFFSVLGVWGRWCRSLSSKMVSIRRPWRCCGGSRVHNCPCKPCPKCPSNSVLTLYRSTPLCSFLFYYKNTRIQHHSTPQKQKASVYTRGSCSSTRRVTKDVIKNIDVNRLLKYLYICH